MVKFHRAPALRRLIAALHAQIRTGHSRRNLQNCLDSVAAGNRLGHRDNQIGQLHKLHQNLGHVIYQSHHLALGQNARLHPKRPHINQRNQTGVNHHVSERVHKSRNFSGKGLHMF